MFSYKRHLMQGNHPQCKSMPAGATQDITSGDILAIASGYIVKATAGLSGQLVVGLAMGDCDNSSGADGALEVTVLFVDEFTVIQGEFSGTTGIAQANLFTTRFDIEDTNHTVNTDDTTGGFLIPVALENDNIEDYADFVVDKTALWNS